MEQDFVVIFGMMKFSKSNEKTVLYAVCILRSVLGFLKMEKVSLRKEVEIQLETKSYT
jgi:hypothetical protein